MHIATQSFIDHPIEFKQINPQDFPNFETPDKIIIEPNEDGYINDGIQTHLNLDDKNTVVINAAVGQGKSYSITNTVQRLYEEDSNNVILIASPYLSLVNQYHHKIEELFQTEDDIFRIDELEDLSEEEIQSIATKRVHVVTTNLLLGNPGDKFTINSIRRRNYINDLISHCKENGKKVTIIYDEIHDAIHNFKEELVFNLWKWKEVLHKNIILSATFNEASKIVIEILAELTDSKIQIIESTRTPNPDKQSDLFLHFNKNLKYSNNDKYIFNLIEDLINNNKELDILCFSKFLADSIYKEAKKEDNGEGIGNLIFNKYGNEIQLCTSQNDTEKDDKINRYDPEKCNIGTNFSTGISIEKEEHAMIIILPPSISNNPMNRRYGIFSNGINSIIQSLARQRTKGEIHIILSPPSRFDINTLPFNTNQKAIFKEAYEEHQQQRESIDSIKYKSINNQNNILERFYIETYLKNQMDSIKYIQEEDRPVEYLPLNFPTFKSFKLNKGEQHLINTTPFFGGDLSAYITYAAITNQFYNCKLIEMYSKMRFYFHENHYQLLIDSYFNTYFIEDYLTIGINIPQLFNEIFNFFTVENKAYHCTSEDQKTINENGEEVIITGLKINYPISNNGSKEKKLKREILYYLHKSLIQFKENDKEIISEDLPPITADDGGDIILFDGNGESFNISQIPIQTKYRIKDDNYSLTRHLLTNLKYSKSVNENSDQHLTEDNKEFVEAFYQLHNFRKNLIDSIEVNRGNQFLRSYKDSEVFKGKEELIKELVIKLKEVDPFLKNGTIAFIPNHETKTNDEITENLHKALKETISLNSRYEPIINNERKSRYSKLTSEIFPLDDIDFENNLIHLI